MGDLEAGGATSVPVGVLVVGTFRGFTDDERFPSLLVEWSVPDREKPITRKIQFRAFNPATGERTKLGETLSGLLVGEKVAVNVYLDAKPAGATYDAFVTFSATAITVLDRASVAASAVHSVQ
jgi:hypothetical protein